MRLCSCRYVGDHAGRGDLCGDLCGRGTAVYARAFIAGWKGGRDDGGRVCGGAFLLKGRRWKGGFGFAVAGLLGVVSPARIVDGRTRTVLHLLLVPFGCKNSCCVKKVFSEEIWGVVNVMGRKKSRRQNGFVEQILFAMTGAVFRRACYIVDVKKAMVREFLRQSYGVVRGMCLQPCHRILRSYCPVQQPFHGAPNSPPMWAL